MAQLTYAFPLLAGLRLERTALLDLLRQVVTVVGILALVALGASLFAFFLLSIPVAVIVLCATLLSLPRRERVWPSIDREEWCYLVGEQFRQRRQRCWGRLFYASRSSSCRSWRQPRRPGISAFRYRVSEVFIAVPWLVVGSAFAVLARAADTDITRFAAAFRQLFDASVILARGARSSRAAARAHRRPPGRLESDPAVPCSESRAWRSASRSSSHCSARCSGSSARRTARDRESLGPWSAVGLTVALVPLRGAGGRHWRCSSPRQSSQLGSDSLLPRIAELDRLCNACEGCSSRSPQPPAWLLSPLPVLPRRSSSGSIARSS